MPHFSQLISQNFCRTTFVPVPAGASRRTYPHSHCYLFPTSSPLLFHFLFFLLLPLPASLRFFPVKPTLFAQNFRFKVCLLFTCVASLRTRTDRERDREREGKRGQAGSVRGEVLRRCREDYLTTVTFPQHKLELGQTLELQLQQISPVARRVSERKKERGRRGDG